MHHNQDIILQQVNSSINELSLKIKENYPELSWQIEFEQESTTQSENNQLFKINVSFSHHETSLLDLSFHLGANQNLSIDGGLVDDQKLLSLLNSRNAYQRLCETVRTYLINSKDIMYYSAARLKSMIALNSTSLGAVKKSLGVVMTQIEIIFLAMMYEVQPQESYTLSGLNLLSKYGV